MAAWDERTSESAQGCQHGAADLGLLDDPAHAPELVAGDRGADGVGQVRQVHAVGQGHLADPRHRDEEPFLGAEEPVEGRLGDLGGLADLRMVTEA
jgi:hypothetical protein